MERVNRLTTAAKAATVSSLSEWSEESKTVTG